MEVLLTESMEKLGEVGEVVEVADGYGRNYLLPKGLAVKSTPHNVEKFREKREERLETLQKREEKAEALKKKLDTIILEFERPAHENKLYGSVRRRDIADSIKQETGEEIERSRINLEAPIEEVGAYLIKVNLYKDINAEVRVRVKEEGEKENSSAETEGTEK